MERFAAIFLLGALGVFALSGCNTMDGLGEDTEKAGEEMQEAVDEAKD